MKTILFVLAVLLCAGLGGYAAQTISLTLLASSNYPGVMVNTGKGWVQAKLDPSLQIITTTNPVTLKVQVPPSPPPLPIKVAPDGGIIVKSLQTDGTGPGTITFYKSDGTSCVLALLTNGSVICK